MKTGEIYTPIHIVKEMLNQIGYNGANILNKKIIDNSAGEGAFLCEILERYISSYRLLHGNVKNIESELENCIYGIEISKISYEKLILNMNDICKKYGIGKINWKIVNENTLNVFGKFLNNDFVIGNPPYIRIHDLKKIDFSKFTMVGNGMYDLYLIFFEIGLRMLNSIGKLAYITPNSFFTSKSGKLFRAYLHKREILQKIIDLGHYNPFKNATTYTCISIIDVLHKGGVEVHKYDVRGISSTSEYLPVEEYSINGDFYFHVKPPKKIFKEIIFTKPVKYIAKNGTSSNLDSFFHTFEDDKSEFVRKNIKISTGKTGFSFFPYFKNGDVAPRVFFNKNINDKLDAFFDELNGRSLQGNNWYEFARSQGIKDTFENRFCVSNMISDVNSIKISFAESGVVIYGGLYVVVKDEKEFHYLKSIVKSEEFVQYIVKLNKLKNGNYYSFNSMDLSRYISYIDMKEKPKKKSKRKIAQLATIL